LGSEGWGPWVGFPVWGVGLRVSSHLVLLLVLVIVALALRPLGRLVAVLAQHVVRDPLVVRLREHLGFGVDSLGFGVRGWGLEIGVGGLGFGVIRV